MTVQTTIRADDLYERDYHAWLAAQANLLRRGDLAMLDLPNLLEEIEAMGRSETGEVRSRLIVILEHLLKHQFAANREPVKGWRRTLLTQRDDLERVLADSPSLRPRVESFLPDAYRSARKRALASFDEYEGDRIAHYRAALPHDCPYTAGQVLDEDWIPEVLEGGNR